MNLINVADAAALKAAGIPYTRKSLYQMHYRKQNPELFVKLPRYLMIDVEAWERHVKTIIDKRNEKIARRPKI